MTSAHLSYHQLTVDLVHFLNNELLITLLFTLLMELYISWRLNYSTISCLQEQRTAPCVNCDAPKHSKPFPCFKKLQIPN